MSLTKFDNTQLAILPCLNQTQELIDQLGVRLSGVPAHAKVSPLEDLGFANNVIRMRGGFFTGMLISWECSVPFVPIDSTVNACGVSVFRLNETLTVGEFAVVSERAFSTYSTEEFNFTRGNHFVSLCEDNSGFQYLVIHASDNRYKFGLQGLYPYNNPWYEKAIETLYVGDRYIRYIARDAAQQFYELYLDAERSNPERNEDLCNRILSESGYKPILYSPHYGMPSASSVAIGCQWKAGRKILLTAPGKSLFLFSGDDGEVYPHGFGMVMPTLKHLMYKDCEMYLNGTPIENSDSFIRSAGLVTRHSGAEVNASFLRDYLGEKKFSNEVELKQIAAYTRRGFDIYHK